MSERGAAAAVLFTRVLNRPLRTILILLLGAALWTGTARAEVDLASFTATPQSGRVLLDWETDLEEGFSRFFLRRGLANDGNYENWDLIPVVEAGGSVPVLYIEGRGSGSVYHFVDQNRQDGSFYCYVLGAEDDDHSVEYFPSVPACVTVGAPTPTPTVTPGQTGTTTPGLTGTASQTLTAGPSPTTGTPTPTITPSAASPTAPAPATAETSAAASLTPLPTFLPTLTPTRTRTPSPAPSPTVTLTAGPLLDATLQPGASPSGVAGLGSGSDLTLRTLIVRLVAVISVVGGLAFAAIYFLIVRRSGAEDGEL